jgi:hypothetical protein
MFVGALFKDSASRVLKHYRPYVAKLEAEAEAIAEQQLTEEENRQYCMDHSEKLQEAYLEEWRQISTDDDNSTEEQLGYHVVSPETIEQLLKTFSSGGGGGNAARKKSEHHDIADNITASAAPWWKKNPPKNPFRTDPDKTEERQRLKEQKRAQIKREKALKEAAKVVVDYRPVMSQIMNDYLFRCQSWYYAHLLSRNRVGHNINNDFVYRFSQPTHVPGFKECWGKVRTNEFQLFYLLSLYRTSSSTLTFLPLHITHTHTQSCHTSELPYVFKSMDVIRTNYSTLSEIAQRRPPLPLHTLTLKCWMHTAAAWKC